jgi:AAA domain-containing protein
VISCNSWIVFGHCFFSGLLPEARKLTVCVTIGGKLTVCVTKKMKLIFLHGMPGVGKLTVARELAALTSFKLFHNHLTVDLVSSVFEFGSPPFVELREKIWLDVFLEAARAQVAGVIFTFAFEKTVREDFVDRVRSAVESLGGEVVFVKLTCSREELEKRLTSESRSRFGKLTSLEQFRELNEAGVFLDPGVTPDQLVLDTTRLDASEAASRIAQELKLCR